MGLHQLCLSVKTLNLVLKLRTAWVGLLQHLMIWLLTPSWRHRPQSQICLRVESASPKTCGIRAALLALKSNIVMCSTRALRKRLRLRNIQVTQLRILNVKLVNLLTG